jgi:hypothetical protein
MRTARESKLTQQERIQAYLDTSCKMTRGPTVCLGSYATLMTTAVIILSTLYQYTEGTKDDRTQIEIHQNVIQEDASSEDMENKEEGNQTCNRVDWIGFELMALLIGISILYKCAMEGKSWYQKRKQSEAEAKQREYEEMEDTIRLMVHILMQEKKTIRKHGEPEETKHDEPILATYERWDALTERMNDMGLLTVC